jgi:acetylornithine deacetylase/succinyl-diaminopimelate desuccinylase-like protein
VRAGTGSLSIPDKATVILDRSFLPQTKGENKKEELARLEAFLAKIYETKKLRPVLVNGERKKVQVRLRTRPTESADPYYVEPTNQFVKYVSKQIKKLYGQCEYRIGHSVADENVIANKLNIPTLCIGPIGGNTHAPNEWVSLNSLNETFKVYNRVISNFPSYIQSMKRQNLAKKF